MMIKDRIVIRRKDMLMLSEKLHPPRLQLLHTRLWSFETFKMSPLMSLIRVIYKNSKSSNHKFDSDKA